MPSIRTLLHQPSRAERRGPRRSPLVVRRPAWPVASSSREGGPWQTPPEIWSPASPSTSHPMQHPCLWDGDTSPEATTALLSHLQPRRRLASTRLAAFSCYSHRSDLKWLIFLLSPFASSTSPSFLYLGWDPLSQAVELSRACLLFLYFMKQGATKGQEYSAALSAMLMCVSHCLGWGQIKSLAVTR